MGLFTKKIGPVFLKTSNQAEEYVEKLKSLQEKSHDNLKEKIKEKIAKIQYGIKGEECILFELKNSGKDMYILHDICLCYGELEPAQIDFIIITRKRIYVIECKNLIGDIEVNSAGDFIRTYQLKGSRFRKRMYSPITQNERHLHIIKEVQTMKKGNPLAKHLFEKNFENNYKSLIVLANPTAVLNVQYVKNEVKEKIVYADQLINKIEEMDKQIKDSMTQKEMLDIANFFLNEDQPDKLDYAVEYEKLVAENERLKSKETRIIEDTSVKVDRESELITRLKAFRLEQSRKENVKPYYIFNDAQMQDLIAKNPQSKEELCQVSGFGKVKSEKYGDCILNILNL